MKNLNKLKLEAVKPRYYKEDLIKKDYLIDEDKKLQIYYAPFDYINKDASIIIVGITPGWTQMELSFRTAIQAISEGKSNAEALRQVKINSSFAGSMRNNLINMLNEIGLHKKLKLDTCSSLFDESSKILHSTSALKYPVFNNGKNYTGASPSPVKNKFLWNQIDNNFVSEINKFENKLIIPLGKNVNAILNELQSKNRLNNNSILTDFPHPSGANGHRVKQFNKEKGSLTRQIKEWEI
jgi:hypothetical protein